MSESANWSRMVDWARMVGSMSPLGSNGDAAVGLKKSSLIVFQPSRR